MQGHRELSGIPAPGLINVFSPAFAALVCSIAFEKGQRLKALGLSFRPNWWWVWAALIPVGLAGLTVLITTPFAPYEAVGVEDMARRLGGVLHQRYSDARRYVLQTAAVMGPLAVVAFAIFFTLSEELGWRGYLYHLWRRFGFWRYSLAVGVIWGVWHWPLIYLFGLDYPDHRELGLFIFPVFTALFSVLMTLARDRGGSVWAAGIMHGALNAMSLVTTITFLAPQFPWTWSGLSGVAAMAIGALLVALLQRRDSPERADHREQMSAPAGP